ncbi:MAG: hypothetical protein Q4G43_09040, partial [Mobilicoccus sp.]|nr:hypothetical protein [Mobilicoccus sp.]
EPQAQPEPVQESVTDTAPEAVPEEPEQVREEPAENRPTDAAQEAPEAPSQQTEPATGESAAATPKPDAAPQPRATSGAWSKVVEAAGGKPIAASEALKILRGE